MIIRDIITKLNQIIENPGLLFEEKDSKFLLDLKEEIKNYEAFAKNYKNHEIKNYEDYKKAKKDLEKLKEVNELFRYIGKENIDFILGDIGSELEKNKRYKINEDLEDLNVKDDELTSRINDIVSEHKGKSNYFIENNKLCLWFDKDMKNEKTRYLLRKYNPIIFSGNGYTKIIMKR